MQSRRDAHLGPEHRGLSTARAVLRVISLLARNPEGVRADEVADALAKSVSTAYNLLASLCEEGVAMRGPGAVYRLSPAFRRLIASGSPAPEVHAGLTSLVEDLLARTHKRSYLGVVEDGRLHLAVERGLQGMARVPGLGPELDDSAHALALGKVALAFAGEDAVDRYVRRGLRAFTPNTIIRPETLRAELREVRRAGLATDRDEFDEDCCCLAAPVIDADSRFLGSLGMSMSRRAFDDEHEVLAETLRDVAHEPRKARSAPRFQACADSHEFLDPAHEPAIA
ncbi:MAG: helix-turn-helix domain-containing protein [Actinomycetota bacterium]|nr:helix-turn-helix domain-containing protein [Actinomycetota bacterium]